MNARIRRRKTLNTRGQLRLIALLKRCDAAMADLGDAQDGIRRLLGIRLTDQEGLDRVTDLSGNQTSLAETLRLLGIRMVESKAFVVADPQPARIGQGGET
jgi:hypothetical protein